MLLSNSESSGMKRWLVIPWVFVTIAWAAWAQEDWQRAYQIGDTVELYINNGMWQKGVVVENPPGGLLRVRCEEFVSGGYSRAGGVYIVYGKNDLRKAGASAQTPGQSGPGQAQTPPSSMGQVPAKVAPGANAAHFKRLIWEQYAFKEVGNYKARGIVFYDLVVVNSTPNVLVDGVPRNMTAAVGATIYRVRTTHDYYYSEGNEYRRKKVIEGYFLISQDKSGQWFAAPDGQKEYDIQQVSPP